MKTIGIGGKDIDVPRGYVQAEAEYTASQLKDFYAATDADREELRKLVLDKRVEFYKRFKEGLEVINVNDPPQSMSLLEKVFKWIKSF